MPYDDVWEALNRFTYYGDGRFGYGPPNRMRFAGPDPYPDLPRVPPPPPPPPAPMYVEPGRLAREGANNKLKNRRKRRWGGKEKEGKSHALKLAKKAFRVATDSVGLTEDQQSYVSRKRDEVYENRFYDNMGTYIHISLILEGLNAKNRIH